MMRRYWPDGTLRLTWTERRRLLVWLIRFAFRRADWDSVPYPDAETEEVE